MFSMRRSIGITATRENAKMMRMRLGMVLGDGAAAAKCRRNAKYHAKNAQNHYRNWAFGEDYERRYF